jgi:adenylate kinase
VQLVLLGAPGSGKGTQAALLAQGFGIRHVSSGELLRRHVAQKTDLGRQVSDCLHRGDLVPDDLVLAVVGDALVGAVRAGGYVLDGIPRTLSQAERAYELARPAGLLADAVICLDVPDDVARTRLASRANEGRADDADPRVIERRLEVFHTDTGPLLEFYRQRGILIVIDGSRSANDISKTIREELARIRPDS